MSAFPALGVNPLPFQSDISLLINWPSQLSPDAIINPLNGAKTLLPSFVNKSKAS